MQIIVEPIDSVFGKGSDHDPFEFLDVAPIIKKPLDLVYMDSDDKALVADSSTSAATTAPDPTVESPKTPRPASPSGGTSKDFKLPSKPSWPDLHASIETGRRVCIPISKSSTPHWTSQKGSLARDRTLKQLEALASIYTHTPVVVLPPTLAISEVVDCIYVMSTIELVYCAPFVPIGGITELVGGRII